MSTGPKISSHMVLWPFRIGSFWLLQSFNKITFCFAVVAARDDDRFFWDLSSRLQYSSRILPSERDSLRSAASDEVDEIFRRSPFSLVFWNDGEASFDLISSAMLLRAEIMARKRRAFLALVLAKALRCQRVTCIRASWASPGAITKSLPRLFCQAMRARHVLCLEILLPDGPSTWVWNTPVEPVK